MNTIDFWAIKRQIDNEVRRLDWSKEQCKEYIKTHYGKSTRLLMNDAQLLHLLSKLQLMEDFTRDNDLKSKHRRNRKRRRR